MQVQRLGQRFGKAVKLGSRFTQRALKLGSRVAGAASTTALAAGNAPLAARLDAISAGASLGASAIHGVHHAAKSELEPKHR